MVSSYQETFDYFAPSDVPLRSKVALTLTEQNFTYVVNADDVARATAGAPPANARDAAAAAGANSLFDLGPGGLSLGFSAQLGVSADFGVTLDAGFSPSASAAISARLACRPWRRRPGHRPALFHRPLPGRRMARRRNPPQHSLPPW